MDFSVFVGNASLRFKAHKGKVPEDIFSWLTVWKNGQD